MALTAQILGDILTTEMSMPANSVWLRDQNVPIPLDNNLYIELGLVSAHTVANNTYMTTVGSDQTQVNEVLQSEDIQIDIFSRSNTVLSRNWEVIAAMQSFYSQQQQELNTFKVFRIPQSMINTSSIEGPAILNRYTLIINCMVLYKKSKLLNSPLGDYYNDFTTRVDDEKTIQTGTPLLQFEITPSTPKPPYNS